MKHIFFVLGAVWLLQVAVRGDPVDLDTLPKEYKECMQELNISNDLVQENIDIEWRINENVPGINNLVYCASKKQKILDADNKYEAEGYKQFLITDTFSSINLKAEKPLETATAALDNCKSVVATDDGDYSVKNWNCVYKFLKNLVN